MANGRKFCIEVSRDSLHYKHLPICRYFSIEKNENIRVEKSSLILAVIIVAAACLFPRCYR